MRDAVWTQTGKSADGGRAKIQVFSTDLFLQQRENLWSTWLSKRREGCISLQTHLAAFFILDEIRQDRQSLRTAPQHFRFLRRFMFACKRQELQNLVPKRYRPWRSAYHLQVFLLVGI